MGQANDRGTPEERIQQAKDRQKKDREEAIRIEEEKERNMTPEEKAKRLRSRKKLATLITMASMWGGNK